MECLGGIRLQSFLILFTHATRVPQLVTLILPIVKMSSLSGERLTPKVLDHYLHHDLVMLPLLWCFLLTYSFQNTQITTKI